MLFWTTNWAVVKRSCLSEGAKAKGMLKHTRGLLVRGPYCLSFSTVKVNSSVLNVVSLCFVQYTYGHNFYNAHNKNVYWQCTGHSECAIQIWGFQSLSRTGLLLKNQSVRSVGSLRRMGRRKSWNIMEQQILGKKLKLVKWRKQVFPPKNGALQNPASALFQVLNFDGQPAWMTAVAVLAMACVLCVLGPLFQP